MVKNSQMLQIIIEAKTGIIVSINPNFIEKTGFIESNIMGLSIHNLDFFLHPKTFFLMCESAKKCSDVVENYLSYKNSNGIEYESIANVQYITLAGKNYFIVNLYEKEDRTVDILEFFEHTLNESSIGFGIVSFEGNILFTNKSLCKLLLIDDCNQIKGKNARIFFDIQYRFGKLTKLKDMVIKNKSWVGEASIMNFDEVKIPVIQYLFLISDLNGNPSYIGGFFRDLREDKKKEKKLIENESKFEHFAELSNIGLYIEKNKTILYSNKKFGEIFDISHIEVYGLPISRLQQKIFSEDKDQYLTRYSRLLDPQYLSRSYCSDINEQEYRIVAKDKSLKWIHHFSRRINNSDGIFTYNIVIDKTQVKLSEIALNVERNRRREERIRSQKIESIGLLAGGIAHDYNNILVGILGNLELLTLFGELNSEQQEIYKDLFQASIQARDLTKQLLTFSKGGSPVKKPESIGDLIRNSAHFILHGSSSRCEFYFDDSLPAVDIDASQIYQVLNNLILNAHQAMVEGGIIKISAIAVDIDENSSIPLEKGEYIKIAVQDSGVGIPHELRNKIFNPYFTTKEKGNGLGLATSYSIIKKHRGYMDFISEPFIGTTFYVYLPVTNLPIVNKRNQPEHYEIPEHLRILILDDDEKIHRFYNKIADIYRFNIDSVYEGGELLIRYVNAKNQGEPYDVVITDLTIPGGMGGKESIGQLRKIDPKVKVIVSSGYSNDPIMGQFEKYGFDEVLPKPFTLHQLTEKLSKLSAINRR